MTNQHQKIQIIFIFQRELKETFEIYEDLGNRNKTVGRASLCSCQFSSRHHGLSLSDIYKGYTPLYIRKFEIRNNLSLVILL